MFKRMAALLIVSFLIFIPVPEGFSSDTSVENTGNAILSKSLGQSIADQITVVDNNAEGGGDYNVVPDDSDPDKLMIVGEGTGGHTVNNFGEVDLEISLPEGTRMIICVNGVKIVSSYQLRLTYSPFGGNETTVSCSLVPRIGDQYYYPEGDMLKLVQPFDDYRNHFFESETPIVLKVTGNDLGLIPLDISIIVG